MLGSAAVGIEIVVSFLSSARRSGRSWWRWWPWSTSSGGPTGSPLPSPSETW